jgi:8-oxo-dGTP diphosphatase
VIGPVRERKLVVAALVRERERILMSRRRPDQAMPDLWEFPGGKVEPGEHPEAALRREVREELGCDIEIDRIEEVVFHAYPDFDLYMLVYASRITGGTPRAIEVADVRWVEAAQLPTLDLLPADYPLARKLAGAATGRQASGGDSG